MAQRVIDKASEPWGGLNSHNPPHKIGSMQAQSCQNCHLDGGKLEKGRGFKKIKNTAQYQPGIYFPDPNAGREIQFRAGTQASPDAGRMSYVRVPHHSDFNPTDDFTLEFLIKFDSNVQDFHDNGVTTENCIISKGQTDGSDRTIEVYLDFAKKIRAEYDTSAPSAETLTSDTALSVDTIYHVAVRRFGTELRIFLDGVSDGTTAVQADNTDTNTEPFIFGMRLRDGQLDGDIGPFLSHGQDHFHGWLDEVRWWTTNRTSGDITGNIDRELDSTDNTNLAGYWKFNEGTGSTSACDSNVSNASSKTAVLQWVGPQFATGLVDENTKGAWDFDGYSNVGIVYPHPSSTNPGDKDYQDWVVAFEGSSSWTVECNVVLDEIDRTQTILFMGDEGSPTDADLMFHLQVMSSSVFRASFYTDPLGTGTLRQVDSDVPLVVGNHYHIAFGFRPDTPNSVAWIRAWDITSGPDGQVIGDTYYRHNQIGSIVGSLGSNVTRLTVGMLGNSRVYDTGPPTASEAEPFNGRIDEIRFWGEERRTSGNDAIDNVLRYGNAKLTGREANLVGYWPLDDENIDYKNGDALSSANMADGYGASIRGFPNSLPPQWTNGLLVKTSLDSDGTTILNAPSEVTSILSFNKPGETEEVLYSQGCNLYKLESSAITEVARDLKKNELLSWSVYADNVYWCSENNLPRTYIDDTAYFMGINRPHSGPIAEQESSLTGYSNKRRYVYTYYDERTGVEGSASPPSAEVDNAGNNYGAQIYLWATSNPRITHIRAYATLSATVEVGTNYYRLAEIANPGIVYQGVIFPLAGTSNTPFTIQDTMTDPKLQLQPPLTLIADPPRKSKFMQSYMDRMYMVDKEKPNRLYFSQIGQPDVVNGLSFQNYEENTGDEITAIATVRSKLVVGKETSVWEQPVGEGGQLSLPLKPRVRHRDHGIASHWSVANLDDNMLIYLNSKGFFVYDGQQHNYISHDIEDQVNNLDESRLKLAYGGHYRNRWEYMCSVSTDGSSTNDVVWAFYYRADGGGAWIKRTDFNATVLAGLRNIRGRDEQFLFGTHYGYLMRYDNGVTDAQSNYGAGASANLTGTATGGTTSTIINTGAAWDTTDDGLRGLQILITDAGDSTTYQATIIDNSATTIIFQPARGAAVVSGDTYKIARVPFEWQSRDEVLGDSIKEDRWVFLDAHHTQQSTGNLTVAFTSDRSEGASAVSRTMDVSSQRRSRLFVNRRATFMSVKFSDDAPNEVKDIESYAWTVVTGGKAPDPART